MMNYQREHEGYKCMRVPLHSFAAAPTRPHISLHSMLNYDVNYLLKHTMLQIH